jgi:[CysO sulfur-carrier protein]-thiocarboxylate-dependent cysteine synthase
VARYDDLTQVVGNTPLVRVDRLSPKRGVHLWAKLEGFNPTGSVKDRVALAMVDDAEASGRISPGDTLLEPSSGNTGIALAMVARLRGYHCTVVMPENVSPERRELLGIYGADTVLSPGDEGSNGAIRLAERMVAENEGKYVMLFQYENPMNPEAHYRTTGPEILRDLPEVDVFVAGLGTGGTLTGTGRYLKEHKLGVQVVAVEPPAGELVLGLRSLDEGYVPPVFDPTVLDAKVLVRNRDSIMWLRALAEREGIFGGVSSGASIAGAVHAAERLDQGHVVALLPEAGWKYLSTHAWTDDLDKVVEDLSGTLVW